MIYWVLKKKRKTKIKKNREIKRNYISEVPGDNGGGIKTRKNFFVYESAEAKKPKEYFWGPQDICSFDYIIIDKASRVHEAFTSYNQIIISELVKNDFIEPVFNKETNPVLILKNNNKGVECIEEKSL